MPTPPITFQSDTLNHIYHGTDASAPASSNDLDAFRTGGSTAIDNDINALDVRIASFESVLIGSIAGSGKSPADYPYDRTALRREFLDEVVALLMRRGEEENAKTNGATYAASGVLITAFSAGELSNNDPNLERGGDQTVIARKLASTGNGVFDNLSTDVPTNSDGRLDMLGDDGKAIFKSYANLIDAVFAEGDKLGNNPSRPAEVVSAIRPLTVDGVTYDRVAQVSGYDSANKVPTFASYLLENTRDLSRVLKDNAGNATLTGPATSSARRLELLPQEATLDANTNEFTSDVDGNGVVCRVSITNTGISFRLNPNDPPIPAEQTTPLLLNVLDRGTEFPDVRILANYRVTASNGTTYLVGLSTEGKVYVTSLNATVHRSTVGSVANLSGLEYLLFYNEARVKILRAQLAYKEAIVREIQDDLKKANSALSDLELQAGSIQEQNSDGTQTYQFAAETFNMNLFNATNSKAGESIFNIDGLDSYSGAKEWHQNRTNLKNYIDRRSAEAQEATLDFQNVLNRFNNALEVMAKLQEKLDTLLKSQLRNIT